MDVKNYNMDDFLRDQRGGNVSYGQTTFQSGPEQVIVEKKTYYEENPAGQGIYGTTINSGHGLENAYVVGGVDDGHHHHEYITGGTVTTQYQQPSTEYYNTTYQAYKPEEHIKRSGVPQVISSSDYKVNEYKPTTDYKSYEIKTDFDKTGIQPYDYRTGAFTTYDYKPTEYKASVEYKPVDYAAYKPVEYAEYKPPVAYQVTEYVEYKPPVIEQQHHEKVKQGGLHEEVIVEKQVVGGSEEAQIRAMAEEIERIRQSNSSTFINFTSLSKEKNEILILISQKEAEIESLRMRGGASQELIRRIEEADREIQRLKISSGGVRIVENQEECNDLLRQIRDKELENEVLKSKINECNQQRKTYMKQMEDNKETNMKIRAGTSWCC